MVASTLWNTLLLSIRQVPSLLSLVPTEDLPLPPSLLSRALSQPASVLELFLRCFLLIVLSLVACHSAAPFGGRMGYTFNFLKKLNNGAWEMTMIA